MAGIVYDSESDTETIIYEDTASLDEESYLGIQKSKYLKYSSRKSLVDKAQDIQENAKKRKETHKSYSITFKLEAIAYAAETSKEAAARKYGVDPKSIREWVKQKDDLVAILDKPGGSRRKKLEGSGRKPMSVSLDEHVYEWIIEMREKRNRVSRKMVAEKAREIHRQNPEVYAETREFFGEKSAQDFVASNGWLNRFFDRHGLTLRAKTTVGQKIPEQYMHKLKSFIVYVRGLRIKKGYQFGNIFAMDETPVWFDMPGNKTVESVGVKSVPIRTTGHEKTKITVVLTAKANGVKLPPYIVFQGKRMDREVAAMTGIYAATSENGWMNNDLVIHYLNTVIGRLAFGNRLMVWDSYKAHTSVATKSVCKQLKLDMGVIPGGCTGLIQAPDVCWNAPFKVYIRESYEKWMATDNKPVTSSGNLRPPTRLQLAQWVKAAWNKLPVDSVTRSFKTCAISNETDGSEDQLIRCLSEFTPEEREDIVQKSRQLLQNGGRIELVRGIDLGKDNLVSEDEMSDNDEVVEG